MPRIFLSYARDDDEPFVRSLYERLKNEGHDIWFDRECMPSRALTFLQEIRDAIRMSDRVLVVLGPAAVRSDYVRAEWQAALVDGKAVTPVLRLGDYGQVPPELANLHCPDVRITRPPTDALRELFRILNEPVPPLGALRGAVPGMPAHFQPRSDDLSALALQMLYDIERPVVLDGPLRTTVLHGMGGSGKSVLAAAFARSSTTRRVFGDGILWIRATPTTSALDIIRDLLALTDSPLPTDIELPMAVSALRDWLAARRCLIIVDNAWYVSQVSPIAQAISTVSRMLLTTRDTALATGFGANSREVGVLTLNAALRHLADWVGATVETLPTEALAVAKKTGCLPFALALQGALARDGVEWEDLLSALENAELDFAQQQFPDYEYPHVLASLRVSIDMIDPDAATRLIAMAPFIWERGVPEAAITRFLSYGADGFEERHCRMLLVTLERKSILRLEGAQPRRRVWMHDLMIDFIRRLTDNLTGLHGRLLDAYRSALSLPAGGKGWAKLPPDEPYLWPYLATHLTYARRTKELEEALLDRDWIEARLAGAASTIGGRIVADVAAMVRDFNAAPANSSCRRIANALRTSARILQFHPEALNQQLFGRLGSSPIPSLRCLAEQALKVIEQSEVWRPSLPALTPPDGLMAVLAGHTERINDVLLLDGRRALSWSKDATLRLWDLEDGSELRRLAGHTAEVEGALLLPDGLRVLSWSKDATLRLWDLEDGNELRTLAGHTDLVWGALLLPDGRRALSWSGDTTLRLWDLEDGSELRRLAGHTKHVTGALLLPDGRRALSWSGDTTLRLWDLEDGSELRRLAGHTEHVTGALLLPDGRRALSWSGDTTLRLWDLEDGSELRRLAGHTEHVTGALLLPDGQRALSWSSWDLTLRLWDLAPGGEPRVLTGHTRAIWGVQLLPDGRRIVSWSSDCTLRLWDLNKEDNSQVLAGHTRDILGVILLPDGRRMVSWSDDATLRLWDLQNGRGLLKLAGRVRERDARPMPDGQRILSWSEEHFTLSLWSVEEVGEHPVQAGHTAAVQGALLLPDGRCVVSWSDDQTLRLWDLDEGRELRVLSGHRWALTSALLLPDARRLLSWAHDETLRLWDLESGGELQVLAGHSGGVNGALLLPDGRRVLSWANQDLSLRLWNLEDGSAPQVLAGHTDTVDGALLLPDGQRVLSWSYDATLRLWDLEDGNELRTLAGHTDSVWGALPLPDSRRVLSWSSDHTLRLWDLEDRDEPLVLSGHTDPVWGALLLPDNKRVLSWSTDDPCLRLWDLEDGGELKVLIGHAERIRGAQLMPDSRRVLSWSDDGTLRLWDLESGVELLVLAEHSQGIKGTLLLPDGRRVLSWSNDATVRLFELTSGMQIGCYFADDRVTSVVLSPDGLQAFVGDELGFVQVLHFNGHTMQVPTENE